ncbi:MAG TPA: response regulator [Thermoanaerobaculia bacterium]|nr:response regulator [Thermoanaerobaculia bacterium]
MPFAWENLSGGADIIRTQILIIDDDPAIRQLLRLVAERRGFSVDMASDGVEALQKLGECQYDLAIIDLMMPRLSGYEVVEQLATKTSRPTVVVVSAMTDSFVNDLDSSVVHSIIRKPFDVELIGSLMTAIVTRFNEVQPADAPMPDNVLDFPEQAC